MEISELIDRVSHQPIVTVARTVSVWGPQLRALVDAGKVRVLSDIAAHPDQHREIRQFHYKHILEPGISVEELRSWCSSHPQHPLPDDLSLLLQRVNGVHLWADTEHQQAYFGILPLRSWRDAAEVEWASLVETSPRRLLVLSYHQNGDSYLVLDTNTRSYYWYDLEDFDNPRLIATNVTSLLEWWWRESNELDPR